MFHRANYLEAAFCGEVDFSGTTFSEAYFLRTLFLENACFDHAKFLENVHFDNAIFSAGSWKRSFDVIKKISFRRVNFRKQEKVIFDNVDMSKVSFIHTDITRVRFRNTRWSEEAGGYNIYDKQLLLLKRNEKYRKKYFKQALKELKKLKNNKKLLEKIIEELYRPKGRDELNRKIEEHVKEIKEFLNNINNMVVLKEFEYEWNQQVIKGLEKEDDLTLDNILSIYRMLRENYDYYLKYEESGKFFVGEMDTKRLFKKGRYTIKEKITSQLEETVLTIYRWLCLYGESYIRPIIWILVTIFGFALLRSLWMQKLNIDPLTFIEQLKMSAVIFFQMTKELGWLTLLERLIAAITLGTLYISLRRKLERRIRH